MTAHLITFIHYRKSDNPIYSRVKELLIPRNPFAASRILRRLSFDIIHYSPLTVFAPVWNVSSKKTATVHGVEEALYPQGYSFLQRFHESRILPLYMRMMDGIATVSEASKRYFVEHYRVKEGNIFITTNGLSPVYRVLKESEKKLDDSLSITKPFVLHISKYSTRKNPVGIVNGFAEFIRSTGLDYQLVCAGKGWNNDELFRLAEAAGVRGRLLTPGFISDKTAVRLFNNASVFLFPSFAEGFGMPNIEAMACGCPVITSNIFAIPEIVGDAAYVLSDAGDERETSRAIEKIIVDEGYKKALVARGLERIHRFDWNDSAKALITRWKVLAGN
jgi:glycosyltransferase involved in cell wall biosynthesis